MSRKRLFRGWDPSFKLHSDDIAGIQGLYGVKDEDDDTDFGGGGGSDYCFGTEA